MFSGAFYAFGYLAVASATPVVVWHRVLARVISGFKPSVGVFMFAVGPWVLIALGILLLVPVAASSGLHPDSHLYPRSRRGYFVWGVALYLLGVVLLAEVAEIWSYGY